MSAANQSTTRLVASASDDPVPLCLVRSAPVRTCVGCRAREAQSALLRVSAQRTADERFWVALPDPSGKAGGRGAYVHPEPACVRLADRRQVFARALRVAAPVDSSAVWAHLQVDQLQD